ncbi:MAG: AAA family ATPase [Burkholderiaceae bacterium]|nr:AAA family ATPase [Burkholderiaceae bacterium]
MLIKSLQLANLLSYGPDHPPIELRPLNVLVGANGSGKSNFLEAISLLQAAPDQIARPVRDGGGIHDWLHQTAGQTGARPDAWVEAVIANGHDAEYFRYRVTFNEMGGRFQIQDEFLEYEKTQPGKAQPYFFYRWNGGHPVLNAKGMGERGLQRDSIQPDLSILAQKRDADIYPELTWVARQLDSIRQYRDWTFGRYATPRLAQKTDAPNDRLEPDCSNLGLMLNRLRMNGAARRKLIAALRQVYEGIEDVDVSIQGGTVQVFLLEANGCAIPATRLSDGTLRYLALLTVLCDPDPPPLVTIEEPELGLHPDMLPVVADLLTDASERTQLIVTTHAPGLVDALTDQPECILVCERGETGTTIERLDAKQLQPWLEKYRLGQLWTSGQLGGNRW